MQRGVAYRVNMVRGSELLDPNSKDGLCRLKFAYNQVALFIYLLYTLKCFIIPSPQRSVDQTSQLCISVVNKWVRLQHTDSVRHS